MISGFRSPIFLMGLAIPAAVGVTLTASATGAGVEPAVSLAQGANGLQGIARPLPNNANYVQQSYSKPAEPSGPVLAQTAMLAMFAGVGVVEVARRRRWNQPGSEH